MSFLDHFMSKKATLPKYEEKKQNKPLEEEYKQVLIQNVEEEKKRNTKDAENMDMFLNILLDEIPEYAVLCGEASEEDAKNPPNASVKLFLPPDKMTAYACIFPPAKGGADIQFASFMEDVKYEGITYGILEKLIIRMVQQKSYFTIFAVARGTDPQNGEPGQITDYAPREDNDIFSSKNGVATFGENLIHPIQKGGVICRIQMATKSISGTDVTGRVIEGHDGSLIDIPKGRNTEITSEGKKLTAAVDGRLYFRENRFHVDKMTVLSTSLEKQLRTYEYPGNLLINGDVLGGAVLNVKGDLIITGMVHDAKITAGGAIRIEQGVSGKQKARIKSGSHLFCLTIEDTELIDCGGNIYAEVMINSTVKSHGSIYALSGRGQISGGNICVARSVYAKRIGNQANFDNHITIGYQENYDKKLKELQDKLTETISTSDKIKKNISTLRCVPQLSLEKKELLNTLIEQRTVYDRTETRLNAQIKELKASAVPGKDSIVLCEELYPLTTITIGNTVLSIRQPETNCRIQLLNSSLTLKSLPTISFEGI